MSALFKLLKSEVKPLTKQLAQEFHDMEASPTERELNPARLKMLREKAEADQLINFNWSTVRFGKRKLRMNGQHSSTMLCRLNGQFPDGLKVHIDEYEVTSNDGLALLFRQFDDRKSGRTAPDVSGAYQGLYEALKDVPRHVGQLGIQGVAWYRRNIVGGHVRSGDDVYMMFGEEGLHPFLVWLGELFTIKTPELRRPTIVAAMHATFISDEAASKEFWNSVARGGDEFEDGHPTTVLDGWLKKLKEDKHHLEMKPGQIYQGCIYAWNAFREEKSIKDVKHDTRKGYFSPNK